MSIIPIKILREHVFTVVNCFVQIVSLKWTVRCIADIGNVVREAKEQASTTVAAPAININNVNTNQNTNYNGGMASYPYKSKLVAALLCFFLGFFGIHRFYVGKYGTGLIWLFTLGLGGIGVIVDFIVILIGGFRDKANMPLK